MSLPLLDGAAQAFSFGLWWPDGDPDHLRARAEAWYRMASSLEQADHALLGAGRVATGEWRGAAADAYEDHHARVLGALGDTADACRQLGRSLDDLADQIVATQIQIVEMAQQVALAWAVSSLLAAFTAGASEGAAAAVTATMVARAWVLAGSLAEMATAFAARVVVTASIGAIEAGALDLVVQVERNVVVHHNRDPFDGFSFPELRGSVLQGFAWSGSGLVAGAITLPPIPKVAVHAEAGVWSTTRRLSALDNVMDHFTRHGRDFGARSLEEYLEQATTFLRRSPPGTLVKTRIATGDIIKYDPQTNTFGVMAADGTPKSFYKPNIAIHHYETNLEYFHAQR